MLNKKMEEREKKKNLSLTKSSPLQSERKLKRPQTAHQVKVKIELTNTNRSFGPKYEISSPFVNATFLENQKKL